MKLFQFSTTIIFSYVLLLYSSNPAVYAQEQPDCAGEARDERYRAYQEESKCRIACETDFYYDDAARSSCVAGCKATRDSQVNAADAGLDVCLYTRDTAVSPVPVQESAITETPETTTAKEPIEQAEMVQEDVGDTQLSDVIREPFVVSGSVDDHVPEANIFNIQDLFTQFAWTIANGLHSLDMFMTYDDPPVINTEEFWALDNPSDREQWITDSIITKLHIAGMTGSEFSFTADIVDGEAQMRLPGSDEWVPLTQGTEIPLYTEIFTGLDTTTVLTVPGVGAIQLESFTNIELGERGIRQGIQTGSIFSDMSLKTGEVEIYIEPDTENSLPPAVNGIGVTQDGTPFYAAAVRGTHFWMENNLEKGYGLVGVYEGEVVVTDIASGKVYSVQPDADGTPGVIVIPDTVPSKTTTMFVGIGSLLLVGVVAFGILLIIRKKKSKKRGR